MCTTVAKLLDKGWYLAKTRDPVSWMRWDDEIKLFNSPDDKYKKLIIQNPDEHEDGFYGGINEKGVAIIATYVHIDENQVSYIRRPYLRLILDVATAKEAVKIIESFFPRIGGNMFVADKTECYGIEGAPEKYFVEKVSRAMVKTNHFIHLPYKNLSLKDKYFSDWTIKRYERASELLGSVKSSKGLMTLLRDTKNKKNKVPICATSNERECFTNSAMIFDTKNVRVFYAQGNPLEVPFKEYDFNSAS